MELDGDACYRAVRARDRRFDGKFFTAVVTTGVYCRPICPARTPLRRNVRFFACAAAAEEAGFRPCRRCRPDAAPGTPLWLGASAAVSRALRLVEDGALDAAGVAALASRVGLGERQLTRLFDQHLGVSPAALARSRRAHFARALIDGSELPMIEVAHASGFRSVRQFNEVMRSVFGCPPSHLRRRGAAPAAAIRLTLAYRPPYAWEPVLAFLGARAVPGVEAVDEDGYHRTFGGGTLSVRPRPRRAAVELEVRGARPGALPGLVRRVRRMFDLDADPAAIAACLRASALLRPRLEALPGLRVPGAFEAFETYVRAVVGQQISVAAATAMAGRLVEAHGEPLPVPRGPLTHRFPAPGALAAADLTALGLTGARARAISAVAAASAGEGRAGRAGAPARGRGSGPAAEAEPEGLPEESRGLGELSQRLGALPGVGPWTAHYLAMRAYGEPDAFPAGDLALRRATGLSEPELARASEAWRPWRAYAAMYLWTLAWEKDHEAVAVAV